MPLIDRHEADGYGEPAQPIDSATEGEILELCEELGPAYFARSIRKYTDDTLQN